jgi:hypothetical protein
MWRRSRPWVVGCGSTGAATANGSPGGSCSCTRRRGSASSNTMIATSAGMQCGRRSGASSTTGITAAVRYRRAESKQRVTCDPDSHHRNPSFLWCGRAQWAAEWQSITRWELTAPTHPAAPTTKPTLEHAAMRSAHEIRVFANAHAHSLGLRRLLYTRQVFVENWRCGVTQGPGANSSVVARG